MIPPRDSDSRRDHELRRRIALETARLISEHAIRDFHLAKRKAAERLVAADATRAALEELIAKKPAS